MEPTQALIVLAGGFLAGVVNGIVGAGALITFPTLLLVGYTPLQANIATTFGVQAGFWSAAYSFRGTYRRLGEVVGRLSVVAISGGALGALLLAAFPAEVFEQLAPMLILVACVLIAVQREPALTDDADAVPVTRSRAWLVGLWLVGVYTGYFGAGGAFLFVAVLRRYLVVGMRETVAVRVLLSAMANAAAAVLFVFLVPVPWLAAGLLAAGSFVGGIAGARVSRFASATGLRVITVAVGVAVAARLLLG